MQALLETIDQSTLELLEKVTENAMGEDEKFKSLKSSNEKCKTKLLSKKVVVAALKAMGWALEGDGGMVFKGDIVNLQKGLDAVRLAKTKFEKEHEERMAVADARLGEIQKRQDAERSIKHAELKRIKEIREDVKERPVKASNADPTMGRSAEAAGIFAGAGGRSSSAKTFKDLGMNMNE